jgi:hypothetical protein
MTPVGLKKPGLPTPVKIVIGAAALFLLVIGVGTALVLTGTFGQLGGVSPVSQSSSNDDDEDADEQADDDEDQDEEADDDDATDEPDSDSDTETDGPSASDEPAPVYEFTSTSGNIRCRITPEMALCHQGTINYAVPAQDCASGPTGVTVGVTLQGATWPCLPGDITSTNAVAYDQVISQYKFTCVINYTTGVTCTNPRGQGFNMEYTAGVTTF